MKAKSSDQMNAESTAKSPEPESSESTAKSPEPDTVDTEHHDDSNVEPAGSEEAEEEDVADLEHVEDPDSNYVVHSDNEESVEMEEEEKENVEHNEVDGDSGMNEYENGDHVEDEEDLVDDGEHLENQPNLEDQENIDDEEQVEDEENAGDEVEYVYEVIDSEEEFNELDADEQEAIIQKNIDDVLDMPFTQEELDNIEVPDWVTNTEFPELTEEELAAGRAEFFRKPWYPPPGTPKVRLRRRAVAKRKRRGFRAEDQLIPWETAEALYFQDDPGYDPSISPVMLKANLRILRVPHRFEMLEELQTIGRFRKYDPAHYGTVFIIDPDVTISDAILDIHDHLNIDRRTVKVHLFSIGRVLDGRWTMRDALFDQDAQDNLEAPDGQFVLDVHLFEKQPRPEDPEIEDAETGKLYKRKRCKSLPFEISIPRSKKPTPERMIRSREPSSEFNVVDLKQEPVVEEEEERTVQKRTSTLLDKEISERRTSLDSEKSTAKIGVEEKKEEIMAEMAGPFKISTPILASRSSASEDPEVADDMEMPELSAELPTPPHEPAPTYHPPNPTTHPNLFQCYHQNQHQLLRNKERVRRRGPPAPKESSSTTYHEITPKTSRPPFPMFRLEGPVPFEAKVSVVSVELKRTPEEVRKMSAEEIDRVFNHIASSHIAKSQQLQIQQQHIMNAQRMQMRHGLSRPPFPLPMRLGAFPPTPPGSLPNIRLPPGAPAGLINRLVPVMAPLPAPPVPPQIVQQWMAQQAALMAAQNQVQRQREQMEAKAREEAGPSTSKTPEVSGGGEKHQETPVVPEKKNAEKTSEKRSRKRTHEKSADSSPRNHFVSFASQFSPKDGMVWMYHPTNRSGPINVPNTIVAISEFIKTCKEFETDPSRFLEPYYRAEVCPKYKQPVTAEEYNLHVTRRRCDNGDVRIPQLDAQQQLELYLMNFEPDEQDDEKWERFYALMGLPLPPDGKFPKGKKIATPGHLNVSIPRATRTKISQPMRPGEQEILMRVFGSAQSAEQPEKSKRKRKRGSGQTEPPTLPKEAAIGSSPKRVPDAEFLQSLAPILHREEPSPVAFGEEEEHSQTSSDGTSEGVRPTSNGSSIEAEEVKAPEISQPKALENSA